MLIAFVTTSNLENLTNRMFRDLMQWSSQLSPKFPMLMPHRNRNSYFRHYFIWKLAQKLAFQHADLILNLEKDFLESDSGLNKLTDQFNWNDEIKQLASKVIHTPKTTEIEESNIKLFKEIESQINLMFKELALEKLFPSRIVVFKSWLRRFPEGKDRPGEIYGTGQGNKRMGG